MARRRILYLSVLVGTAVFYWANQEWLGWMLLLTVLCLPVLSLVLSLPALFSLRIRMHCPSVVQRGNKVYPKVFNKSWLPAPVYEYKITVHKPLTQKSCYIKNNEPLPTMYCGVLRCRIEKIEASDFLGLFRFRLGTAAAAEVTVRPRNVPAAQLPKLRQRLAVAWKPKPGGGFAENHEMRLYRPGDSLNQIHWKLSAKTSQLVVREPMIPLGQRTVVGLCLFGSDEELDMKFGRLMGVCNYLLDIGMSFEIQAVGAGGMSRYTVSTEAQLMETVDILLGMEPAAGEQESPEKSARVYWIGGTADEN